MPGSAQCIAKLNIIQKNAQSNSRKAVVDWSTGTLGKSKELCPVKTGKLRRSGYNKIIKNTLTEFHIRTGFNTVYALKQHETPGYHHPVGQWKYLSIPFNQRQNLLLKMLENAWRASI